MGTIAQAEWQPLTAMRHICGNVVMVQSGALPHCPMCAPVNERRAGRCEQVIRKVMRERRRLSVSKLKDLTNYSRYGIVTWQRSFDALVRAGELRLEEGKRSGSMLCVWPQRT